MLATCRFRSDKQSMPKISEAQTDFGAEISILNLIKVFKEEEFLKDL
jgi:hypothetical protein